MAFICLYNDTFIKNITEISPVMAVRFALAESDHTDSSQAPCPQFWIHNLVCIVFMGQWRVWFSYQTVIMHFPISE